MKEKIHPKYGKATVRCVCGETFETGSTQSELKVEICSKCHPFYTGKQKLVDSGGRVDRFQEALQRKISMHQNPAFHMGCGVFRSPHAQARDTKKSSRPATLLYSFACCYSAASVVSVAWISAMERMMPVYTISAELCQSFRITLLFSSMRFS